MEYIENLLKYFESLENQTRDKCAEKYRELRLLNEHHVTVDWKYINGKILQKWSSSGLEYIKKHSILRKSGNGRVWVTAVNGKTMKYDAFIISVKDFYDCMRVGFSSRDEAMRHADSLYNHFSKQ